MPLHKARNPSSPSCPPQQVNLGLVELGKKLYFDPRLSKSGFISCNSCHNLCMGGTDNLKTSIGDNWQQGPINAPTVLNSSLNVAQFWDGRAADLKAQAGGPIANPGEMAFTHTLAIDVLESIPAYVREFKQVFGKDKIDIDQVTQAIADFEETLVTPNSRFDKWLLGEKEALSADELAGYKLFKDSGCVACHNGPAVGGNSFQKMGVVAALQGRPARPRAAAAVTGKDADRFNFKVPTLRNVELTYPVLPRRRRRHPDRGRRHHGPPAAGQEVHARRERQDRRLPEDADRRPAELQAADPAAVERQDAAAEPVGGQVS